MEYADGERVQRDFMNNLTLVDVIKRRVVAKTPPENVNFVSEVFTGKVEESPSEEDETFEADRAPRQNREVRRGAGPRAYKPNPGSTAIRAREGRMPRIQERPLKDKLILDTAPKQVAGRNPLGPTTGENIEEMYPQGFGKKPAEEKLPPITPVDV